MTAGQSQHDMLVAPSHDEHVRQCYVADLRFHLLNDIGAGMKDVYRQRVQPAFQAAHGRAPKDKREVHQVMMADPYARTWSTMMRAMQEMMWDSVLPAVEREEAALASKAATATSRFSTLKLDPAIEPPYYAKAIDIHCMPGGYYGAADDEDVTPGALYDRGVYVYQMGLAGPLCDGIGRSVAEFIKRRYPDLNPGQILDVGCTVGHNTGPFCAVFPDAEVHAIDASAPLLRYAHARAESLQLPIRFEQMDARSLSYPDDSFDIVFSCILFHETSHSAHRQILKEIRRVLKPGGININMELPPNEALDPYDGFQIDWDAYYNNEPYYAENTSTDVKALMAEVGFEPDAFFEWLIPDFYFAPREDFEAAARAQRHSYGETGRWGEIVRWYGYGARKI
jgi:SAM-dependent methyltransferase